MKKRIIALIFTATVAFLMTVSPALAADHYQPGTGLPCNNTYTKWSHTGYYGSVTAGSHTLTDGRICYKTRLIYLHAVRCSSCTAFLYTYTDDCTEVHDKCPNYQEWH